MDSSLSGFLRLVLVDAEFTLERSEGLEMTRKGGDDVPFHELEFNRLLLLLANQKGAGLPIYDLMDAYLK